MPPVKTVAKKAGSPAPRASQVEDEDEDAPGNVMKLPRKIKGCEAFYNLDTRMFEVTVNGVLIQKAREADLESAITRAKSAVPVIVIGRATRPASLAGKILVGEKYQWSFANGAKANPESVRVVKFSAKLADTLQEIDRKEKQIQEGYDREMQKFADQRESALEKAVDIDINSDEVNDLSAGAEPAEENPLKPAGKVGGAPPKAAKAKVKKPEAEELHVEEVEDDDEEYDDED